MTSTEDKTALEKKAKEYAKRQYVLTILNLLLSMAFLVFVTLYLTFPLRAFAQGIAEGYYLQLGVYFLCFCLTFFLISLPLDFYSGYILEHNYELSNQTVWAWIRRELKGNGLGFAITLPIVEAMYFLIKSYPENWWVLAGILFTLVSVVMARIAPVLILPIFYKSTPLEDEGLRKALTPLAEEAGGKLEGVYKINFESQSSQEADQDILEKLKSNQPIDPLYGAGKAQITLSIDNDYILKKASIKSDRHSKDVMTTDFTISKISAIEKPKI